MGTQRGHRIGGGAAAGRGLGCWRRSGAGHRLGHPFRRPVAVDRHRAAGGAAFLASLHGRSGGGLDAGAVAATGGDVRPGGGGAYRLARHFVGVPALHGSVAGAVHRGRRHPAARRSLGHPGGQHPLAGGRHRAGRRHGHHWCLHGADPSPVARQPAPATEGPSGGLLHPAGVQHRWLNHPLGRSAALHRLSARRAVPLAAAESQRHDGVCLAAAAGGVPLGVW